MVGFRLRPLGLLVVLIIVEMSTLQASQGQRSKTFTVVLDAGHGGHDPGKVSGGYNEKDVALKIVLLTGALLEADKDIKVVYTRKSDVFVDLYKRGEIANKSHANLFVSVHCNAHHSNVDGAETYILGLHANKRNFEVAKAENEVIFMEDNYQSKYSAYDIDSPESVIGITIAQEEFLEQSRDLADLVQNAFVKELKRNSRGVKQAGFIVLHQSFMPSVLIETGFITNKTERKFLTSTAGQRHYSECISKAITDYKKRFFAKTPNAQKIDRSENAQPAPVSQQPETSLANTIAESVIAEPSHDSIATNSIEDIVYKVQLFASSKKISFDSPEFKGLSALSMEGKNGIYRYFLGKASTFGNAQNLKNMAIDKGFDGCFIVAYKGSKKITLKEALQKQNQ